VQTKVTKMGYINCDIAYESPTSAVMLQGLVLDSKRAPLTEVQVISVGRDYYGRCYDAAGADGRFKSLIAQFDSQVDVVVSYRMQKTSDEEVEVFFPREVVRSVYKHKSSAVLQKVPGCYKKSTGEEGQPVWILKSGDTVQAKISWNNKRKCWQNAVFVKEEAIVAFTLPAGDDPGLPFSDAWHPMFEGCHVPKFTRGFVIHGETFGPFKTGEAGSVTDIGEIMTKA